MRKLDRGDVWADRYRVERYLGAGGSGAVYAVEDLSLRETVALKLLNIDGFAEAEIAELAERFRREVRLARRITHRSVARTFDFGEHEGTFFLTMEYLDGGDLRELVRSEGALEPRRAATIASLVAQGLVAAHAAGIVHRDLKPQNVMVTSDGRVVLTDFGTAKAADSGDDLETQWVVGTPAYMAPEQLMGQPAEPRSDLYALGLVLYLLLTGKRAFLDHDTPYARMNAEPLDPRDACELPDWLAEWVVALTHANLIDRPASAELVCAGLDGERPPDASDQEQTVMGGETPAPEVEPVFFAPLETHVPNLAVLPFRYRGPEEYAYCGEAVAEELIDLLARTRGLQVLALGATLARGADADPRQVGQALGVDHVVAGSVVRRGDTARITCRLIEVATGQQLLTERFETPMEDMLRLEDEIAHRIVESLRLELTLSPSPRMPERAVERHLLGRRLLKREDLSEVCGYDAFQETLALAPKFAPALASRALASVRMWFVAASRRGGTARDWNALAEAAVAEALQRAPGLPESHLAHAMREANCARYRRAVRSLGRALEVAPTHAQSHKYLGELQCEAGRAAEGVERLRFAAALDPSLVAPLIGIARIHALHGELDAYRENLELAARRSTGIVNSQMRFRVAVWHGDRVEIARALDLTAQTSPEVYEMFSVAARVACQELPPEAVSGILTAIRIEDGSPRFASYSHQLAAEALGAGGHAEHALVHIQRAYAYALTDVEWVERCPALGGVRELDAFPDVARSVRARADTIWAA